MASPRSRPKDTVSKAPTPASSASKKSSPQKPEQKAEPPKKKEPKKSKVPSRPPSPAPAKPSSKLVAQVRLLDLRTQMEFRHAALLKLNRELEAIRAKRAVLEKLPVGMDAFREEYDRLYGENNDAAEGDAAEADQ